MLKMIRGKFDRHIGMKRLHWKFLIPGLLTVFLLMATVINKNYYSIKILCSRRMPPHSIKPTLSSRLVLLVRTCTAKAETMRTDLLHSLLTFWNPNRFGGMIIVLDDESINDHIMGGQLEEMFGWITVKYEHPMADIYHNFGHHRTQWSNFYCDNYTNKEFVGIVDTDSLLVTLPIEEDFFVNDKPVIQARIGTGGGAFWHAVPIGTTLALGLPEMARCMSYFPVIIKTKHFRMMRDYISQQNKKPFDQVFRQFSKSNKYSQFNIMCNYLWYFHREEYEWRFWEDPPGWVAAGNPNTSEGQSKNYSHVSFINTRPIIKAFIHYGHHSEEFGRLPQQRYIEEGYCFAINFTDRSLCNQTQQLHKTMFRFEGADWLYDTPGCREAQFFHYYRVAGDIKQQLWNMKYVKEKIYQSKVW